MDQELNEMPGVPASAPADEGFDEPSDVNWADLAEDSDTEGVGGDLATVEGDQKVVAPAAAVEAPPVSAPAPAAATPGVSAPVQAAVTPPTPPVSSAPVAPAAPAQPQPDYAAWRQQQVEALTGAYKLSDDEAAAALTEPEVLLPKLLARMQMQVLEQTMQGVHRVMPDLVQSVQQTSTVEQKARDMFFGANQDLADARYAPSIQKAGQLFRQTNPTATPEQAVAGIGNIVRMMHGLPAPVAAPAAQAPAAPAAPRPFTPARGGGGAAGAAPVTQNLWAELDATFEND